MVRRLFLSVIATVALAAPPQRIVSTAPSITEMLYALGLGDRVAGVTNYCHYPPEARLKPKIGDYASPNLEAIAALKPDLVILPDAPARLGERVRAMRLKTVEVNQDDIAALYNSIRIVGGATGTDLQASRLIDSDSRQAGTGPRASRFPAPHPGDVRCGTNSQPSGRFGGGGQSQLPQRDHRNSGR